MKAMASHVLLSFFGEHPTSFSHEYNIAPANVVAQVSLSEVYGDKEHISGISAYRFRLTPDGPEKAQVNSDHDTWPVVAYVDRLSSVTFGLLGRRVVCTHSAL